MFKRKKKEEEQQPAEEAPEVDDGGEGPGDGENGGDDASTSVTADREFFDCTADEAAAYNPEGIIIAEKKRFDPRPALKVAAAFVAVGLFITAVVLLWPSSTVRVPDVVGKGIDEAMKAAGDAGFKAAVVGWRYSESHSDGVVIAQHPEKRAVSKKGVTVRLTVSKGPSPELGSPVTEAQAPPPSSQGTVPAGPLSGKTVCIDPGHQALPGEDEWEDPGMTRRRALEAGKRGSLTGLEEHEVPLNIALKLKGLLEKDGVAVVMSRESNDVSVSNVTRAEVANNAEADLAVHIHTAYSADPMMEGCAVMYPAGTTWTEDVYEKSKTAALFIVSELSKSTDLADQGVFERHDLTELNWSKVPAVEAEIGYMSSPMDEDLLSEESFRWKAAWGLRDGIKKYLTNP